MGRAVMGMGISKGEKRAVQAAYQAISSPLLEDTSIQGAKGVLINISGGPDLTLYDVTEASTIIQEAADPEANIIFGSVILERLSGEVMVTVIATGFEKEAPSALSSEVAVKTQPVKEASSRFLDRPAFLRKVSALESAGKKGYTEDEWDVPTFLRRNGE
jgi:cell division protein FtsZ